MKISELAMIIENTIDLDNSELIEALTEIDNLSDDFEVGNYRFISVGEIDEIQQNELEGDLYILGCFNASFLAGVLDIDQDVIESMQSSEAFEAVGKLIISMDKLEELQSEYASVDGYGHHFAHYDHHEHEIGDYLAFKIN